MGNVINYTIFYSLRRLTEIAAFEYWTSISLTAETNVKNSFINYSQQTFKSVSFREFGYLFEIVPISLFLVIIVLICERQRINRLRKYRLK